MISKAKSCIGGFSLFQYVINENKGYELFRNGVCGETALEIFQEMKIIQDQNQRAKNKLFSFVLSPNIEEGKRMTKTQLKNLLKDYFLDLGFIPEKEQFLAFVHDEKQHIHIHILMNRIQQNFQLHNDHFIGLRAQWSAHRTAEKFGLISAKQIRIEKIKEAEKESVQKSLKTEIFKKHQTVLTGNPLSLENYISRMYKLGISFIPSITKQGQLQGFRLRDQESQEEFKASDIHKSLSLKNLLEVGLPISNDVELHQNLLKSQEIAKEKSRELKMKIDAEEKNKREEINNRENIKNQEYKPYFHR
jgi:hypothetical protein